MQNGIVFNYTAELFFHHGLLLSCGHLSTPSFNFVQVKVRLVSIAVSVKMSTEETRSATCNVDGGAYKVRRFVKYSGIGLFLPKA